MRPITRSVTKNMRENYVNIHKNGYHIYKNICNADDSLGLRFILNKQIDSKYGGPIFNGAKNDKKRLQSTLRCNNKMLCEGQTFLIFSGICPILNLQGCKRIPNRTWFAG